MTPPRLPRALLSIVLPHDHRRVVVDDLDAEFDRVVARCDSTRLARAWYWRAALSSLPGAFRLRHRASVTGLSRDIKFGVRQLGRNPAFAVAAIVTLTLGIAATSAVVTIGDAVLRRPLPFRADSELVIIKETSRARPAASGNVSWPDYLDYQTRATRLAGLAAFTGGSRTITSGDSADRVSIAMVTTGFFHVLGVTPALGRDLTDGDMTDGAPLVAILTDGAWRRRFGADPTIIDRAITVSGVPVRVVGVLPASFEFPLRGTVEFFGPMRPSALQRERRDNHWMELIGRLSPGTTVSMAQADLDAIVRSFALVDPSYHGQSGVVVQGLREAIVGDTRAILRVLLIAAVFVLLAACANIAGLLLTRAAARARELDVRLALGATPARLGRQLLAEHLPLTAISGLAGALVGQWAIRAFVSEMPAARRLALPHLDSLSVDGVALAWSGGITIAAAVLLGVAPAWRARRTTFQSTARGGVGGTRRDHSVQSLLAAAQIAFALVLLFGTVLIGRSLTYLLDVSPGFSTDRLLLANVTMGGPRYATPEAVLEFHRGLLAGLAARPSIAGAAMINQPPLGGRGSTSGLSIPARTEAGNHYPLVRAVSANYFSVIGLPVIAGRAFADTETLSNPAPRVAIVNQRLANAAFGGRALGESIVVGFVGQPPLRIVGVVADEQFDGLERSPDPVVYFPYALIRDGGFTVVARTHTDPAAVISDVRRVVAEVDRTIPVSLAMTMEDAISQSEPVFRRRTVLLLFGAFALITIVLAGVGLYGVLAQSVVQRTRELGLRAALGAGRPQIVGVVLRRGLAASGLGLVLGLVGCALLGPALGNLLFGVGRFDALTMTSAVAGLSMVALLSCILPARRAARIDPAEVLRNT